MKRSLSVWQISPPGWRCAGGNVAVFGRTTKKKEGVNFKRNFVGDGWRRLESCCYLNRENRKSEIEEIAAEMSTTDEVRFSEGRLNQVKSGLETWREVVIKLDSVLGKLNFVIWPFHKSKLFKFRLRNNFFSLLLLAIAIFSQICSM